jgi:hypothetical protein
MFSTQYPSDIITDGQSGAMSTRAEDVDVAVQPDRHVWNTEQAEAIKHHLEEIAQGSAFKWSHRSQQFLRYVIEKALEGSPDHLKERTIGIELFQRSPAYDTGEDAIVRVTASDVRRRLLQHYGRYGAKSRFRIKLPSGSYVPEIVWEAPKAADSEEQNTPAMPAPAHEAPAPVHEAPPPKQLDRPGMRWAWAVAMILSATLLAFAGSALRWWKSQEPIAGMLPWSAMFRPGHATQLITSDPNIEELQELTGHSVSISDYANQKYVSESDLLSPERRAFYTFFQHADEAAAVDTPLAASIARIVPADSGLRVRSARSIRMADLQTDDNLILLGSPRSNPWFELFEGQLDFRFAFNKEFNQEFIENVHPAAGEQAVYMPTARGFATGESFSVVALVQNSNQSGQVLLLAGANGEGTEAAGHLVTDKAHLLAALQSCKISPRGPLQDFELLLHLHTMAGSPGTVEILSCHRLSDHRQG